MRFDFEPNDGVLTVEPTSALAKRDFLGLAAEIQEIKRRGDELNGILIHVRRFPGYERFSDMLAHARFIKNHSKDVEKVALCTDTPIASLLAAAGRTLAQAQVRKFAFDDWRKAQSWILS